MIYSRQRIAGIITLAITTGALITTGASASKPQPVHHTSSTEMLSIGDETDMVRAVQLTLRSYGYGIGVDGIFGPQTDKAVRHWQKVNGLVVDGIVGPQTLGSLGLSYSNAIPSKPVVQQSAFPSPSETGQEVARQALLAAGATQSEADFGATICVRESRCRLNAINQTARTRDDSWGPWQINYYGRMISREQTIGSRQSNISSWDSAARNFLKLLREGGRCHWIPPNYCAG